MKTDKGLSPEVLCHHLLRKSCVSGSTPCASAAYASLADARSSFGDTGGGGDGAPQRLISAWSSLRSTISSRPQRVFNALGHLIANEGSDEGKRLQLQL